MTYRFAPICGPRMDVDLIMQMKHFQNRSVTPRSPPSRAIILESTIMSPSSMGRVKKFFGACIGHPDSFF
jgi:hypothetical protein